jgi:hypothetical protein
MAFSALVIPVPELEFVVAPRLVRRTPEYVLGDTATQAHITLLGPFVDQHEVDEALLGRLAAFFGARQAFEFSMSGPPAMLGGIACLRPDQPDPFQSLTRALWRDYPDHPPGNDAFTDYIPHLTLDYRPGVTSLSDIAAQLEPVLPIHATADVACLNWYEPGQSTVLASFGFGQSGRG